MRLLRLCTKPRGQKKGKTMLLHQDSWNFEVKATWISLIGWPHKTSSTYSGLSNSSRPTIFYKSYFFWKCWWNLFFKMIAMLRLIWKLRLLLLNSLRLFDSLEFIVIQGLLKYFSGPWVIITWLGFKKFIRDALDVLQF